MILRFIFGLCLLAGLLSGAIAENILFLLFPDTGSHYLSAKPIIGMLRDAGHNITVVRASEGRFDVEPGVRTIDAIVAENDGANLQPFLFWKITVSSYLLPAIYGAADTEIHKFIDKYPEQLRQLFNEPWDLIVMDDLFTTYAYGLAILRRRLLTRRGEPSAYILLSTSGAPLNSAAYVQTIGRNWVSSVPLFPWLPRDEHDSFDSRYFTHRASAVWGNSMECLAMNIYTQYFQTTGLRRLALPDFSWNELYAHTDWTFVDYFDRIGSPLSLGTEVVNIGARCKSPTQNRLPYKLAAFVDDPASKGTVYVAFGTYADLRYAPAYIVDAFVDAFNRLRAYRVIFAAKGGSDAPFASRLGPHVRVLNWAPQAEILAHPKTRVFVTHSGLKSMKEGVCAAVPFVLMPMYAEQAHNGHWGAAAGYGPVLNKYGLSAQRVYEAISTVLEDPTWQRRADKVRQMHVDRPLSALDTARFHVERTFRRRRRFGATQRVTFQRRGQHINTPTFVFGDGLAMLGALVVLMSL